MAIGYKGLETLHPVAGVRLGVAKAGIRYADRYDLVLVELAADALSAGVFTRNAFCAAPVQVARAHLEQIPPRYWLINAGNANAGTGEQGLRDARLSCREVARLGGCSEQAVLPFSTGVIGENLPMDAVLAALPHCFDTLDERGWALAAEGIMTTDTVAKGCSRQIEVHGRTVTVTGIAKGSGMIRPDMATMLAFVATDAALAPGLLEYCLQRAVEQSFNRITVDGDTSTNDACMLVATGAAGGRLIEHADEAEFGLVQQAVDEVCRELAQAIVRDGEGATKFITVEVGGGLNALECESVAYTIAHSPLVKTAFFAADPNWGRILAAVGRAQVPGLQVDHVDIFLDQVCIVRQGERAPDYDEAAAQAVMDQDEITVRVELGRGESRVQVWTCDLSYDYVRINAEYRS